ncbi:hypothetical protein CROQUDRAFT_669308 [Cronartium quercuum f. sp. fusiforme G11]|uniref:Uncharacterized protein n=1 Tax=Cronartium quercuum f. sp. fusiforme G11 TaxID=708437 RepID=A0A9P6N4Y7_9BASI|nr:hypothetical protein CROQUDRAFT_55145 [Cronartium quercuum f. sp. fusiforme G11]KAG0149226.1 hypothetical protein CROQUDRAFT_669308 [Cronartium quercuum f. sp. fusiforme G11]
MPLNIPAITTLLSQVTSPKTILASLTTRNGGLLAYYSPNQPEEFAKTVAALAAGLLVSSPSSNPLSALCELGSLYVLVLEPYFLIVLLGDANPETVPTLALKARLLEDRLREPLSRI